MPRDAEVTQASYLAQAGAPRPLPTPHSPQLICLKSEREQETGLVLACVRVFCRILASLRWKSRTNQFTCLPCTVMWFSLCYETTINLEHFQLLKKKSFSVPSRPHPWATNNLLPDSVDLRIPDVS